MNPWLDRGGEPFANTGEVAEWLRERDAKLREEARRVLKKNCSCERCACSDEEEGA